MAEATWKERVFSASIWSWDASIPRYGDRQDLNINLLKLAKREGCRISIGTDSHGPSQLGFMDLGVALAAIAPERILNFLSLDELLNWARRPRALAA